MERKRVVTDRGASEARMRILRTDGGVGVREGGLRAVVAANSFAGYAGGIGTIRGAAR
jgi:hypothetical protein